MAHQEITICIPKYENITDRIQNFTDEENLLMLLVGINAVETVKDVYVDNDLSKEIEQKIKNIYQKVIDEREQQNKELKSINDVIKTTFEETSLRTLQNYQEKLQEKTVEIQKYQEKMDMLIRECSDKIQENQKYYENQFSIQNKTKDEHIINYLERISSLEKTIMRYENNQINNEESLICDLKTEYKTVINGLQEKLLLQEISYKSKENKINSELLKATTEYNDFKVAIERQKNEELTNVLQKNESLLNETMRTMEELKKEKNACNTVKGTVGEDYICELMKETFYSFENFNIIPTAKISHSGDFIMNFKNFSILIDSKNYTNGVGKKEVKKLTDDINSNKHIKIAWLVSLHTPINGFSTNPVMYDIKDNVCYCYINSLNKNENPQHFLKTIWFCCSFIFDKILNVDSGEELLNKYKKNEIRIKNIVDKMLKKSKERVATLLQLKDNFEETERDLKELLNDEILSVYEEQTEIVKKWWNINIQKQENNKLKSKKIYEKFISNEDNKVLFISIDAFKIITKSFLCDDDILLNGKTDKAEYTYLNVDFIV